MNLYLLVEGYGESKFYPAWLSYVLPQLTQVQDYRHVVSDHYFLLNGAGHPSLYNHLENAFKDVNQAGNYDYLLLILDSDDKSASDMELEVLRKVNSFPSQLNPSCQFKVVVQMVCIETWLLGNRMAFNAANPAGNKHFPSFQSHFDVSINDPEQMDKWAYFQQSKAHFHYQYLLNMLLCSGKIRYRKSSPPLKVKELAYFQEMTNRIADEPTHLNSFRDFIDFCSNI